MAMILHYNNTTITVDPSDESYLYRGMTYTDDVTLYFVLPEFVDFPIGTYIDFLGQRYTLEQPARFTKNGTRQWEYTLLLKGPYFRASKYKFYNPADRRLKFEISAKPQQLLTMIVQNLNDRDSGWTVGDCIDADAKLLEFNHTSVMDAFKTIAEAFDTEYHFDGKEVIIGRVEYGRSNPVALSYDTSLMAGVGRDNYDGTLAVERLYVQGGERNIDPSKYGSKTLLLPKGQELTYEGVRYQSDESGSYIERSGITPVTHNEDSLDCSHRFPQRIGTVSQVVTVNEGKHLYDIIDDSIPNGLDYSACLIKGETMTIIFQSGLLAGREFEARYFHEAAGTKEGRRFELAPIDEDGDIFPNSTWRPMADDKYIVFGVQVPDSYIQDDGDKSGASWDMFRDAAKYLYEHENPQFSYSGSLNTIWAKEHWNDIKDRLILGGMVRLTDTNFLPDGALIRIVGVKNYINDPQAVEIEISNKVCGMGGISSELRKIDSNEVVVEHRDAEVVRFAKRRFRDASETAEMLSEAIGSLSGQYTGGINPITAQMMQLLVGDQALQFNFVDAGGSAIPDTFVWNEQTRRLSWSQSKIKHYTIGIDTVKPSGQTYKQWTINGGLGPVMADADKKYYIYLRCLKNGSNGSVEVRETTLDLEDATYYNFLFGLLNSEFEGTRSIARLYGYTEVLPGQISAYKFASPDGYQLLDFLAKIFRVGDENHYMAWNLNGDGKMRLKGSIVVSPDNDESPLICSRGKWVHNVSRAYFGDVWTFGGQSWLCKDTTALTPATAVTTDPVEGTKWTLYAAKGAAGADGDDGEDGLNVATITLYQRSEEQPDPPASDAEYDFENGHLEFEQPEESWSRTVPDSDGSPLWVTTARAASRTITASIPSGSWSTVTKFIVDGVRGDRGKIMRGPTSWVSGFPYQGLESDGDYVDFVFYANDMSRMYFCRKSTSTQPPTDTEYWEPQTVQEFVATKVLYTALAYVENLGVNVLKIANAGITFGAFMPPNTEGENNGNYMLWAGAARPEDAPFSVDKDGKIWATQGNFSGFVRMPFQKFYGTWIAPYDMPTDKSYLMLQYTPIGEGPTFHWYQWAVLPEPSQELSGFTYNIIIPPAPPDVSDGTTITRYLHPLTISAKNNALKIYNYSLTGREAYSTLSSPRYSSIRVHTGFLQIVCDGSNWIVVQSPAHFEGSIDGGSTFTDTVDITKTEVES